MTLFVVLSAVFSLMASLYISVATDDTGKYADEFHDLSNMYARGIPIESVQKYYKILGPTTMLGIIESNPGCHIKGHNIGKV